MNKIREVLFQSMKKKKSTQKNDFSIGVVVSVSPLKVRLYGSSVSIPCFQHGFADAHEGSRVSYA